MKKPITAALLLGCAVLTGSAHWSDAGAQTAKYKEAPALAELVKAGKLPPVDALLPEQPLQVPVTESTGQYGGVWRRAFLGPADANNYVRVVFDSLFRFFIKTRLHPFVILIPFFFSELSLTLAQQATILTVVFLLDPTCLIYLG